MEQRNISFKSFEELECWKACRDVRRFIIELVKRYPKEEKFTIVDDMKLEKTAKTVRTVFIL